MPIGIAKIKDKFTIQEFEDYDKIPSKIILPHPLHNSNANKIEPTIYNLTNDIKFSWTARWGYNEPPYLFIIYKEEIVEYISNAPIEKVKDAIIEYSNISEHEILRKHISYLKDKLNKLDKKNQDIKRENETELSKSEIKFDTLQKSYNDLLEILKNK